MSRCRCDEDTVDELVLQNAVLRREVRRLELVARVSGDRIRELAEQLEAAQTHLAREVAN